MARRIQFWGRFYSDLEGVLSKAIEHSDLENMYVATNDRTDGLFSGSVEVPAQLLAIGAGAWEARDVNASGAFKSDDPIPAVLIFHLNRFSAE
jgi:hypothetical protein